ncbi:PH domain-containing protein [Sphingosinicella sp. BN140058]|uniref:PH domain-containing protein n=1 Tax=Sphingosinicella sp. BN140058 TaxID=1892855 RepID=UPI0013EDC0D4|nr:PH domain-containing protein [Sphingosinicella sp. BN140058]
MSDVAADRRIHPGAIALRFLRAAPRTVLAIPAAVAFASDRGLLGGLAVAAVIGAALLFGQWLHWYHFRYGVGAHEIVIESGLLNRNRRSIPFDRIQDVDIERALLARLFGLAKVKIETGAGGKDEGVLDSVSTGEAARLREAVRAWRDDAGRHLAPAVELAAGGEADDLLQRPLFTMPLDRVLLFGLFDFSLVYIGGVFAALQAFDDPLKALFGIDIYDAGRWIGLADKAAHSSISLAAIAFVTILAILLGVITSILRVLARDFGFRLTAEGDRFRRERGLLTRTEAVIAKKRIQLAYVETGLVRRRFGWFWLSFQTLGEGADGSGHQVAAPFAQRDEIDLILDETVRFRLPPPPTLQMVSQRHVVRALIRKLLPPTIVIVVAAFWWRPALFFLAGLPVVGLVAAIERRFHRYALDGDLLFVARGVLKQRLFVVPVASMQTVSIVRGWLQRRLGVASVMIDTAGASLTKSPSIIDLPLETARMLAAEIAARRLAARRRGGA